MDFDIPWLAIAFSAGQEHRLSPSFLGTYSGQCPSAPGCPWGTTLPTGLFGRIKLARKRIESQVMIYMFRKNM